MAVKQQQPMSEATTIPKIARMPRAIVWDVSRQIKSSSSQNIPPGQEHSPLIEAKSPPNHAAYWGKQSHFKGKKVVQNKKDLH